MITEYIPNAINLSIVPAEKYENCLTREEYDNKKQEKGKLLGPDIIIPDDPGIDLFCGDYIIGIYQKGESQVPCLYQWKRNNPREIINYCRLNKFKISEKIGDIELIFLERF